MGLRAERSGDNLHDWLLAAAEDLVSRLDSSQYSELFELASNARQTIMGSVSEWKPFESLLRDAGIDRRNRDHVTALVLALLPKVLKQEKDAREAAVAEARARLAKPGLQAPWGPSGNFTVSTKSSSSIDKGAKRFPLALDRLAKK